MDMSYSNVVYLVLKYDCPHPDKASFPTVKYYTVVASGLDKNAMCQLASSLEPGLRVYASRFTTVHYYSEYHTTLYDDDKGWVK